MIGFSYWILLTSLMFVDAVESFKVKYRVLGKPSVKTLKSSTVLLSQTPKVQPCSKGMVATAANAKQCGKLYQLTAFGNGSKLSVSLDRANNLIAGGKDLRTHFRILNTGSNKTTTNHGSIYVERSGRTMRLYVNQYGEIKAQLDSQPLTKGSRGDLFHVTSPKRHASKVSLLASPIGRKFLACGDAAGSHLYLINATKTSSNCVQVQIEAKLLPDF
jgi:hypothetical protein